MARGCIGMRFNGATARRPWRTGPVNRRGRPRQGASMGPQPEGRGELRARPQSQRRQAASMGPQPEGRGELVAVEVRPLGVLASMGPRPEGRGEPFAGRLFAVERIASMRPQPEGRGERRQASKGRRASWQRFNAATARRPWRTPLQLAAAPAASSGFNAATARRPWRTPARHASRRPDEACFNAATARRPWRTPASLRRRLRFAPASMRPRPEGRGEHVALCQQPRKHAPLQCGHGPKAVENSIEVRTASQP